jgi:2-polyprenyl-3-methyl-5-hydroxy-6-metoxy-1,4-benzoquinol methylase
MYRDFAYIYDELLYDLDTEERINYLKKILTNNNVKGKDLLDICCGTGTISTEMAKLNYDVTGIDLSNDMLSCAMSKSVESGLNIKYLNCNMVDFSSGKYNVILCLLDSVNYLLDDVELEKFFSNIFNMLKDENSTFIFDINSKYKLEEKIGNNFFYDIDDYTTYIWENEYNEERKICKFDLTFFVKEKNGLYRKYNEIHYEKAYSNEKIIEMLHKCNIRVVDIFDDLKFTKPKTDSERIFYICKKGSC